jgi:hypothetical protein
LGQNHSNTNINNLHGQGFKDEEDERRSLIKPNNLFSSKPNPIINQSKMSAA